MAENKMDMAKVLAMLSQTQEAPPPLENVERRVLEIPYINRFSQVEKRTARAYIPENAPRPMPLIFVPHYDIPEDSMELRGYLKQGWVVASPSPFLGEYNVRLTDDDLVFNNAAMYELSHLPEIDRNRIAVVGGSAGGYMTLMLNGTRLGLCAAIANGPIANIYFTFETYWQRASKLNQAKLAELMATPKEQGEEQPDEDPRLKVMRAVSKLPIPFIAALSGGFLPIVDAIPEKDTPAYWEARTGTGVADRFCNPLMINHSTSDVLLPVDQISHRKVYVQPGDTLPKDFDMRMPENLPGKMKLTLEEALPTDQTRTEVFFVPTPAPESVLPWDEEKRFNINIFNDGAPEGYGSHSARMDVGRRDDVPYLKAQFAKGAAETCSLTPAMLRELLLRHEGKSLTLPAHEGVDDSAYGSLAMYRKDTEEMLQIWAANHGAEALEKVWCQVLENEKSDSLRETLKKAWTSCGSLKEE